MTRPLHLKLNVPTCWDEINRAQIIELGRWFWYWPLNDQELGKLLMDLHFWGTVSGRQRHDWRKALNTPEYLQELREHLVLALEQADFFRWVNAELCYREPKLVTMSVIDERGIWLDYHGPTAGLRSVTYAQFFDAADDLANAYLQSRHPKHLAAFCASLYLPKGEPFRDDESAEARVTTILERVPQHEQHAALYDFLAMRRWLFTQPQFAGLAEFPEPSAEGETPAPAPTPPPFSDVVYSLAGQDVTKVESVKQQPLWTVLESIVSHQRLAEKAKENQGAR